MREDQLQEIEKHLDDFAYYERDDFLQDEDGAEARRAVISGVINALGKAGYVVFSKKIIAEFEERYLSGFWLWLKDKRFYTGNPFEVDDLRPAEKAVR